MYDLVLPTSQVGKVRQGYFLQEDLLFRVWAPHGEAFTGDPIVQIVLPSKCRTSVIQTAHDNVAGHMGVKKKLRPCAPAFFLATFKT